LSPPFWLTVPSPLLLSSRLKQSLPQLHQLRQPKLRSPKTAMVGETVVTMTAAETVTVMVVTTTVGEMDTVMDVTAIAMVATTDATSLR